MFREKYLPHIMVEKAQTSTPKQQPMWQKLGVNNPVIPYQDFKGYRG